jgi:hypothetical protein
MTTPRPSHLGVLLLSALSLEFRDPSFGCSEYDVENATSAVLMVKRLGPGQLRWLDQVWLDGTIFVYIGLGRLH